MLSKGTNYTLCFLLKEGKKDYEALHFVIDDRTFFAGSGMHFSKSRFFITVRPSQAERSLLTSVFLKMQHVRQTGEGIRLATSIL